MPSYLPAIEESMEDGVLTALAPLKPAFEVTYFADVDSDYKKAYIKPRISVMVHSGKSGDLLDMDEALSEETVFLQICIEAKSRRGENGIYDLKRQVLNLCNGLKLNDWQRLIYNDFKYSERDASGVWIYNLLFTTKQVNQQVLTDNYLSFPLVVGPPVGP